MIVFHCVDKVNNPPLETVAFKIAPRRRAHTILVNQTISSVELLGASLLLPAT